MSTKKSSSTTLRKKCQGLCGKEKSLSKFYKCADNPMFPDGRINNCVDCVQSVIDVDDMESVIGFFRQINKPFYRKVWEESLTGEIHPISAYLRKINGLQQYKGETFDNSDGLTTGKTSDIQLSIMSDTVENIKGEKIIYSDDLVDKWGVGYQKNEYLKLEKYYQDMRLTHEIHTPVHIDQLMQLAYMSVDRDRIRQLNKWTDYSRVSKTMEDMISSAGFKPVDMKIGSEAMGMQSFSQVWADIEREGFVEPDMVDYPEDDIDQMLLYYVQFAQRLVGKSVSSAPPENWRENIVAVKNDDIIEIDEDAEEIEENGSDE